MQYMLLIYEDEQVRASRPEAQRIKLFEEYGAFTQSIVTSGHFRAGAPLQSTSTATTVRQRNGKPISTDGPFAESKEQLGGYYLVECQHLDEAIAIAGRIPSVRAGGSIEVRPVMAIPQG